MRDRGQRLHVLQAPEEIRMLDDHAGGAIVHGRGQGVRLEEAVRRGDGHQLAVEVGEVRGQDLAILGVHAGGRHHAPRSAGGAAGHEHSFGHGRAPVVEAGVRHVHAGELGDQGLILKHRLERALARLRLVRRVGRVELAAAGDEVHQRGNEVIVSAAAQETRRLARRCVLRGQLGQMVIEFELAKRRRQVERTIQSQLDRHHGEQVLERVNADRFEHRPLVVGRVRDVGHGQVGRGQRAVGGYPFSVCGTICLPGCATGHSEWARQHEKLTADS